MPIKIQTCKPADESALFSVFYSAVHEIASQDYTQEQVMAWAPADIDMTQ